MYKWKNKNVECKEKFSFVIFICPISFILNGVKTHRSKLWLLEKCDNIHINNNNKKLFEELPFEELLLAKK